MIDVKANRFIQALVKLMFLSAFVHVVLLIISWITRGGSDELYFLNIVGVNLYYPSFVNSEIGHMTSVFLMIALYTVIYFFFTHESRRTR